MPTFTNKLNLTKPLVTEHYDVAIVNGNSDKIDTFAGDVDNALALKANQTELDELSKKSFLPLSSDFKSVTLNEANQFANFTDGARSLTNFTISGIASGSAERVEVLSRGVNKFDGELMGKAIVESGSVQSLSSEFNYIGVVFSGWARINFTPTRPLKLKPNTTYNVNFEARNAEGSATFYLRDEDGTLLHSTLNLARNSDYTIRSRPFTTTGSGLVYMTITNFINGLVEMKNMQISEGSTTLPYQPFQGSTSKIRCNDRTKFDLAEFNGVKNEISFSKGKYTAIKRANWNGSAYSVLTTPITIEEKDFASNGIVVEGYLQSHKNYTELYLDDFNIAPSVKVDYEIDETLKLKNAIIALGGTIV